MDVVRIAGGMSVWWLTKDGDRDCLALYEKHYSAYKYRDGRKRSQFVGPGQTIVLRTLSADALFVWRDFIDDCVFWHTIYERWYEQDGINCAVFRNESQRLSSELVRQADAIADFCWPGERHYTYVNAEKVRSTNAGFCFLKAGWRKCGRTKSGLLILERNG
jgi:hypothetical protein